ncbi:type 1 glutamine amidotransferase [Algoriphagus sp. 4150]|uniref:ThuA domain-containing protein n=1 Tax=Algoriphagus sp. 4150 TaxID=2817756 RepID=UPI0028647D0B|nr:ThuA domain-containing protein [Algoriphagus sp. 4150]MDR7132522.1 type 1 glutamine amidotransferase [Algoriphagus sp. 4150]
MKKIIIYGIVFLTGVNFALAQNPKEIPLDQDWKDKITDLAPEKARFPFKNKKKVLVFSLHTGFVHWVNPHTEAMFEILGEKSGAFEVTSSSDIEMIEKDRLKEFDLLILNNTNSKPEYRNLFVDKLSEDSNLDSVEVWKKAATLEQNIINHVKKGGGLFVIHGGNTTLNNSMDFSKLIGGSFDYHPKQQAINVRLVDPNHPLVKAFPSGGFTHVDEPYFYNGAYSSLDFKPLLYFNNAEIEGQRKETEQLEGVTYVAWIRKEGKGHVLYCSPSHNGQSFENPDLLQFYLDGMQYLVGDVEVDETPIGK